MNRPDSRWLRPLLCAVGAFSLWTPLPAALAQPTAAQFGEVVDVELVNVEVWVTDRDGHPVRGLEADDFEVREDGKVVKITHFAEVLDGRRVAPGEASAAAPAAAPDGAPQGPESHLVLYLDDLHFGAHNRSRLVEDLRDFLASGAVAPERVLIMRQTRELFTEAAFGADLNTLDKTLARLAEIQPLGVQTEQTKRLAIDELQTLWEQAELLASSGVGAGGVGGDAATAPCPWFLPRAMPLIQNFARTGEDRIRSTLDHLTAVASFLAGLPGPKTLLYVADSLETSPGSDLFSYVQALCPGLNNQVSSFMPPEGLHDPFRRLTRHANTNRVTIYSLQAFGLKPSGLRSAQARAIEPRASSTLTSAVRRTERDGLALLASQTGGRAIFNRSRFGDELAAIGDELNSYYSLAYQPPPGDDGDRHRIKVEVTGPDLRIRHRRGYRDKTVDEKMEERLESAIHLGMMSNPLAARLGAGALEATGKNRYRLSLHVLVPVDRIAFLPTGEGDLARLRVRVLGRGPGNQRVADDERDFLVARPPADAETLDLLVPLEIRGGPLVLAVALRDEATRELSYLSTGLDIQDPDPG